MVDCLSNKPDLQFSRKWKLSLKFRLKFKVEIRCLQSNQFHPKYLKISWSNHPDRIESLQYMELESGFQGTRLEIL